MKLIIVMALLPLLGLAQKKLTETEVLDLALKNSALFSASVLEVKQSQQLQKTGFNLSNPQLVIESPTGLFRTIGVSQSFEFPTVYVHQSQLLKQQTALAKAGQKVTENHVKYQIKTLYLTIQYLDFIYNQYKVQDSVYNKVMLSAQRQYDAGQIDYLEKTFTEAQSGEVHNQYVQSASDLEISQNQLQIYTASKESITAMPLVKTNNLNSELLEKNANTFSNPTIQYFEQQKLISQKTVSLERSKALPGFVVGYQNQGEKDSAFNMRLNFGVTIPLWFWQYKGKIDAAKTGVEISEQKSLVQQQVLSTEMQKAQGDFQKYSQSIAYYETKGLKQTNDIINASRRFFENGQKNYIEHLRNINDAYTIKLKYAESLKNYNQSIININYLSGSL